MISVKLSYRDKPAHAPSTSNLLVLPKILVAVTPPIANPTCHPGALIDGIDRPNPKQVRSDRRKRTLTAATDRLETAGNTSQTHDG